MQNLPSGERYLYQLFSLIKVGHLKVTNPQGQEFNFGDQTTSLHLIVHNQDTYDRVLTFGAMGFCEAYMEGWWDEECDRLSDLIGLFHTNGVYTKARSLVTLPLIVKVATQRLRTMPILIQNSRKNVQHHYDLGNDFYQHFLDSTLTYSSSRLNEIEREASSLIMN